MPPPPTPAFQDNLLPFGKTCFGCGQQNDHGLRIRSHWEGEEGVCHWTPQDWHTAGEGFLNGGVIATVMDCHAACTAMAAAYRGEGREIGSLPLLVYVTASLQVDFLKPTPLHEELELRARVVEIAGRRITMACSLSAAGTETARSQTVFVRVEA